MPTSFRVGGRQHGSHANRGWTVGPAYSEKPRTLRNNMHENREISSTPWSDDQGRSAKATNRTADMHVLEKSDCAVLPVNQPNKGGQPSAEAGEVRAQTRENIVQSHMHPTPSGKRMSQGLDGVRKAAKERKQERFSALLHHLKVDLLRDSFYALQRKASPGIDGVTWQEYETGLEDRLVDLHSRVHRGAYRAKPSRRVFILKADGRQRPLGSAAPEDKIVQQAVVTILNQIYEVDFKGFSYGFRPGRSPHQALDALTVGIQRKRVNWVLDADIRGFFDNFDHDWMMRFKWVEAWRKKLAKGDVIVVRYADDTVMGFQYRAD